MALAITIYFLIGAALAGVDIAVINRFKYDWDVEWDFDFWPGASVFAFVFLWPLLIALSLIALWVYAAYIGSKRIVDKIAVRIEARKS